MVAELNGNPYSGDVFVFRSKRADRLKFLVFDGTGMILATKWLEEGRFTWPPVRAGNDAIDGDTICDAVRGPERVAPDRTAACETTVDCRLRRLVLLAFSGDLR